MLGFLLKVLDVMRFKRCIGHIGKAKLVSTFVVKQIDIANEFVLYVKYLNAAVLCISQ